VTTRTTVVSRELSAHFTPLDHPPKLA
jgi:hypothetical protein